MVIIRLFDTRRETERDLTIFCLDGTVSRDEDRRLECLRLAVPLRHRIPLRDPAAHKLRN